MYCSKMKSFQPSEGVGKITLDPSSQDLLVLCNIFSKMARVQQIQFLKPMGASNLAILVFNSGLEKL